MTPSTTATAFFAAHRGSTHGFRLYPIRLTIDGIGHCAPSSDGKHDLHTRVPAGQIRTITFRTDGK